MNGGCTIIICGTNINPFIINTRNWGLPTSSSFSLVLSQPNTCISLDFHFLASFSYSGAVGKRWSQTHCTLDWSTETHQHLCNNKLMLISKRLDLLFAEKNQFQFAEKNRYSCFLSISCAVRITF